MGMEKTNEVAVGIEVEYEDFIVKEGQELTSDDWCDHMDPTDGSVEDWQFCGKCGAERPESLTIVQFNTDVLSRSACGEILELMREYDEGSQVHDYQSLFELAPIFRQDNSTEGLKGLRLHEIDIEKGKYLLGQMLHHEYGETETSHEIMSMRDLSNTMTYVKKKLQELGIERSPKLHIFSYLS